MDAIGIAHVDGGHIAAASMVDRLQKSVNFPGMLKESKDYIEACPTFQAKKKPGMDQCHTFVAPIMRAYEQVQGTYSLAKTASQNEKKRSSPGMESQSPSTLTGGILKSRMFTKISKALGINMMDTTEYNLKGNGQVQRFEFHATCNGHG